MLRSMTAAAEIRGRLSWVMWSFRDICGTADGVWRLKVEKNACKVLTSVTEFEMNKCQLLSLM